MPQALTELLTQPAYRWFLYSLTAVLLLDGVVLQYFRRRIRARVQALRRHSGKQAPPTPARGADRAALTAQLATIDRVLDWVARLSLLAGLLLAALLLYAGPPAG